MGAGRRTETYIGNGQGPQTQKQIPLRGLAEQNKLASVIFGCTTATYDECIRNMLFGLPKPHLSYVDYIVPGMPIFLFNYHDRKMHGIFESVSDGGYNISPYAWTSQTGGRGLTPYSAQVRVQLRSDFEDIATITENLFKQCLKESYYDPKLFYFEVDKVQTRGLIQLFEKSANLRRPAPPSFPPLPSLPSRNGPPIPVQTGKQWKEVSSSGSAEVDEKLNLKNATKTNLASVLKGPKYYPSSLSDPIPNDGASQQQPTAWREEDSLSDDSTRTPELNSEEEALRSARFEMADQEPGLHPKSAGYRPKMPLVSDTFAVAQNEETQRVYEKLRRLTNGRNHAQGMQLPTPPISEPNDGDLLMNNRTARSAGGETVAQDASSIQESASLSDERERIPLASVSELEPTTSTALNKSVENTAQAVAQIRQGEAETRRLVDGTRVPPENWERRFAALELSQASLVDEVQSLKREVTFLRRQLGYADVSEVSDVSREHSDPGIRKLDSIQSHAPHNIYLLGGLGDQLSKLESVMVWTPSTDQLRTVAPMLSPRCCAAASVLGELIYVFGGGDGSTWYDSVERYDARADQWLTCASMKIKRGSLGGVAVGDRIFAIGGGNGLVSFSEVESYDSYLGSWYPSAPMCEKRFCVAATELGGALYALGGFDGDQYLKSMERFDPREPLWSRLPPMNVKRGSLSTAVLNGKIYALGGYDGDGILDVVEIFDVRAGRWELGPQMSCQRAYGAVGVVGEELYYMGGLAEEEAVDSAKTNRETLKGTEEDEDGSDGEDDGYRSWRSQWQATWQHFIMGSSVPGLTSNSSHQRSLSILPGGVGEDIQPLGLEACVLCILPESEKCVKFLLLQSDVCPLCGKPFPLHHCGHSYEVDSDHLYQIKG